MVVGAPIVIGTDEPVDGTMISISPSPQASANLTLESARGVCYDSPEFLSGRESPAPDFENRYAAHMNVAVLLTHAFGWPWHFLISAA